MHAILEKHAPRSILCAFAICLSLSSCMCEEDPAPTPPAPTLDMPGPVDMPAPADMPEDMPDPEDMPEPGDMPTPEDMPNPPDMPDPPEDMADMVDMARPPDMDPGEQTCPTDLRDSCIYEVLSCFGDTDQLKECSENTALGFTEAIYGNGARARYFERAMREFRATSPEGAMCFQALANEAGAAPESWTITSGATMLRYQLLLTDTEAQVACPSGEVEICSRTKFDLFYTWPEQAPVGCPAGNPAADECIFDVDCASGQQCCSLGAQSPRQCLSEDTCMPMRAPKACETALDCAVDEECSDCSRAGRECVPTTFASRPDNALACIQDLCSSEADCAMPGMPAGRVCCLLGNTLRCAFESECDDAPDPNPVCQPSAPQACASPVQDCCFVGGLNEFRCIDENAPCRTNICFADTDCGANQECCGANAASNTPGACASQCVTTPVTCQQDSDCAASQGPSGICCAYPGYTVGTCVADAGSCRIETCEMSAAQCGMGESCCNASPLTTPTCINASTQVCPPNP